jgi:DNA-binding XRE family transcriptional regulator
MIRVRPYSQYDQAQWERWCRMANGAAICRYRCECALTHHDLARAVGVSAETIARIETGQYHGSNELIDWIAHVLWQARTQTAASRCREGGR